MKESKLKPSIIKQIQDIPSEFIRDLLWLLQTGNIHHERISSVHSYSLTQELENNYWLSNISSIPSKQDFENLPLGKYTEQLLGFYFSNHPRFKLHAFNLQLIQENITVGEIDFLISDLNEDRHYHLEFAIKYYLKVDRDGKFYFLGPSTKDWFERKIEKLEKHQLLLLHEFNHLLNKNLQSISFQPKVLIKGSLFYPYLEWLNGDFDPEVNGWWIHLSLVDQVTKGFHFFKIITNKKSWIFPFESKQLLGKENVQLEIKNWLTSGREEIMLVRFNQKRQAIDRGFVMRSNWPN